MVPIGTEDRVTLGNPPLTVTGMCLVKVDSEGRLVEFHAVPPELEPAAPSSVVHADWTELFELAGLQQSSVQAGDAPVDAARLLRRARGLGGARAGLGRSASPSGGSRVPRHAGLFPDGLSMDRACPDDATGRLAKPADCENDHRRCRDSGRLGCHAGRATQPQEGPRRSAGRATARDRDFRVIHLDVARRQHALRGREHRGWALLHGRRRCPLRGRDVVGAVSRPRTLRAASSGRRR